MWLLWLTLSSIAAILVEYVYRTAAFSSFWAAVPYMFLPILCVQAGLFYGFRAAPSLFLASAIFSLFCVILRSIVSYWIGESLGVLNWVGVLLLICGTILLKVE